MPCSSASVLPGIRSVRWEVGTAKGNQARLAVENCGTVQSSALRKEHWFLTREPVRPLCLPGCTPPGNHRSNHIPRDHANYQAARLAEYQKSPLSLIHGVHARNRGLHAPLGYWLECQVAGYNFQAQLPRATGVPSPLAGIIQFCASASPLRC